MYDIIIQNGMLIDGTGSAPYAADVAIADGKIAKIGTALTGAAQIIDASGLVVTPGFIDSHSHADAVILTFPEQKEKIEQGITTNVAGQCGASQAPKIQKETGTLCTMGQYLQKAVQVPQGCNILTFTGHKSLRIAAMGNEDRAPTEAELQTMKDLLAESVDHGSLGISFGLQYAPGCFSQTDELIELAKVAAAHGGMASAHLRNEGEFLLESVNEFLEILRQSGARGVLSHHKALHAPNWGKVHKSMALLEAAVAEGIDIYSDAYPYTASSTSLTACFIDKQYLSGSTQDILDRLADPKIRQHIKQLNVDFYGEDLSGVLVIGCGKFPEYEGLRIPEIANLLGTDDHHEAVLAILQGSLESNKACYFSMCEEDVKFVLSHPRTMVCTDSSVAATNAVYHPRLRASFPRVLGKYVREEKIVPLEEMIRKITSLPAHVYNLPTKGLLKEGYDADICVFDPDKIIDRSEYCNCSLGCEGLNYVLVGGGIAAVDGVSTGARNGRVLLRNSV